jgi:hypothetical protein
MIGFVELQVYVNHVFHILGEVGYTNYPTSEGNIQCARGSSYCVYIHTYIYYESSAIRRYMFKEFKVSKY